MKRLLLSFGLIAFLSLSSSGQTWNFDTITAGSTGNFGNGWICNTTTGYRWEANSGLTTSQGTGPSEDHTTGTGIYLYTEASVPAAAGDTTILTSPPINLSGLTNPGLEFWFHMAGTAMGDLIIDVQDNGTWNYGIDSLIGSTQSVESDPWAQKFVDLSSFTGPSVTVRFRAGYGSGWSGDMAIDDVSVIDLPSFDASISKAYRSSPYYMTPHNHLIPDTVKIELTNNGVDTATNAIVSGTSTSWSGTGSTAQLLPNSPVNVVMSPAIPHSAIGTYTYNLDVSITENDTITYNDSATISKIITDSTFAREADNMNGGIGFTGGTGIFGQMFELQEDDTLTSISVKLQGPQIGMSFKMKVYHYGTSPGNIIDSTDVMVIPTTDTAWYVMDIGCPLPLTAGKYFFAADQMTTQNLALGYSSEFYEPFVCWYRAPGAAWTDFETAGFQVSLGIRPNFAPATIPSLDLGADTAMCNGVFHTIQGGNGWDTYAWSNGSNFSAITVFQTGTHRLTVTDIQGCTDIDTIEVTFHPKPQLNWPLNDKLCPQDTMVLFAGVDSTFSYLWQDGTTSNSINIASTGVYWAQVTSQYGCVNSDTITIGPGNLPNASLGVNPTDFCVGDSIILTAPSATGYSYIWSDGSQDTTLTVNQTGSYWVLVTNGDGCKNSDTIDVNMRQHPVISLGQDTTICLGDELTLSPGAFSTYHWTTGESSNSIVVNDSGSYGVVVFDQYGCTDSTGITIAVDSCNTTNGINTYNTAPISIFPNPASSQILIRLDHPNQAQHATIISSKGAVIRELTLTKENTRIDLTSWPPGLYTLILDSGHSIRFIKQ